VVETRHEFGLDTPVIFCDFAKYFDTIDHGCLNAVCLKMGIPPEICRVLDRLRRGSSVVLKGETRDINVDVRRGVIQGRGISPFESNLMGYALTEILRKRMSEEMIPGFTVVPSASMSDTLPGKLTRKLKVGAYKTTCWNVKYADDVAFMLHSVKYVRPFMNSLVEVSEGLGLAIHLAAAGEGKIGRKEKEKTALLVFPGRRAKSKVDQIGKKVEEIDEGEVDIEGEEIDVVTVEEEEEEEEDEDEDEEEVEVVEVDVGEEEVVVDVGEGFDWITLEDGRRLPIVTSYKHLGFQIDVESFLSGGAAHIGRRLGAAHFSFNNYRGLYTTKYISPYIRAGVLKQLTLSGITFGTEYLPMHCKQMGRLQTCWRHFLRQITGAYRVESVDEKGNPKLKWSKSILEMKREASVRGVMFYIDSAKIRALGRLVRSRRTRLKELGKITIVVAGGKRPCGGGRKLFRHDIRRLIEKVSCGLDIVLSAAERRKYFPGREVVKLIDVWEKLFEDSEFSDVICVKALEESMKKGPNEFDCEGDLKMKSHVKERFAARRGALKKREKDMEMVLEARRYEAKAAGSPWAS
jgi:hypothetical protein